MKKVSEITHMLAKVVFSLSIIACFVAMFGTVFQYGDAGNAIAVHQLTGYSPMAILILLSPLLLFIAYERKGESRDRCIRYLLSNLVFCCGLLFTLPEANRILFEQHGSVDFTSPLFIVLYITATCSAMTRECTKWESID